jgi:hypothetical protein
MRAQTPASSAVSFLAQALLQFFELFLDHRVRGGGACVRPDRRRLATDLVRAHPRLEAFDLRLQSVEPLHGASDTPFAGVCVALPNGRIRTVSRWGGLQGDQLPLGLCQLAFQRGHVLFHLRQAAGEALLFVLECLAAIRDLAARLQRGARQLLPVLPHGRFGTLLPLIRFLGQLAIQTLESLLLGQQVGAGQTGVFAGVLHFTDQRPQQFGRVFGFFEQGVDIGSDDVAQAGKSTHAGAPMGR